MVFHNLIIITYYRKCEGELVGLSSREAVQPVHRRNEMSNHDFLLSSVAVCVCVYESFCISRRSADCRAM